MNSTIFIHQHRLFENVSAIKNKLESDVKIMAVIKDNAYGHGFDGIASALYSKVDWFCVARAEEGNIYARLVLRNPILVFEIPNHRTSDLFPKYDLTLSSGRSREVLIFYHQVLNIILILILECTVLVFCHVRFQNFFP